MYAYEHSDGVGKLFKHELLALSFWVPITSRKHGLKIFLTDESKKTEREGKRGGGGREEIRQSRMYRYQNQ